MKYIRKFSSVVIVMICTMTAILVASCATFVADSKKNDVPWLESYLVENPDTDINQVDSSGRTALHWAAFRGDTAMVSFLLDHGAKMEIRDRKKMTPLLVAASSYHWDIASLLLSSGADPDVRDANNETLLHMAVVALDIKTVKFLLDGGANPDTVDKTGKPVLLEAIQSGRDDIALALMTAGAHADIRTKPGRSILMDRLDLLFAKKTAVNAAVAAAMLEHGADTNDLMASTTANPRHYYGYDLLVGANDASVAIVAKAALRAGYDVTAIDQWGTTPIFWVVSNSMLHVLEISADGKTSTYNPANFAIMDLLVTETSYAKLSESPSRAITKEIMIAVSSREDYNAFIDFFVSSSISMQSVYSYLTEAFKRYIIAEYMKTYLASSIDQTALTKLAQEMAKKMIDEKLGSYEVVYESVIAAKRRTAAVGATPTAFVDLMTVLFRHVLGNTVFGAGTMIPNETIATITGKYSLYMRLSLLLMELKWKAAHGDAAAAALLNPTASKRDSAGESLFEPVPIPDGEIITTP